MSREYTPEEIRRKFLEHVWRIIEFWAKETQATSTQDRLEGVAFSILTALDGEAAMLPAFIAAPSPHREDREYLESQGENWYPENDASNIKGDISGSLHEQFHRVGRELGILKD